MEGPRKIRLLDQLVEESARIFEGMDNSFDGINGRTGEEYYSLESAAETAMKTVSLRSDELLSILLQQTTLSPKQVFGLKVEIETEKNGEDETGESPWTEVERSWEEVVNEFSVSILRAELKAARPDLDVESNRRYQLFHDI